MLRVDDPARDRHVLVVVRAPGRPELVLTAAATGMPVTIATDAAVAVVDVHANGVLDARYFEQGTNLIVLPHRR